MYHLIEILHEMNIGRIHRELVLSIAFSRGLQTQCEFIDRDYHEESGRKNESGFSTRTNKISVYAHR